MHVAGAELAGLETKARQAERRVGDYGIVEKYPGIPRYGSGRLQFNQLGLFKKHTHFSFE
jgi:hypothetical protein